MEVYDKWYQLVNGSLPGVYIQFPSLMDLPSFRNLHLDARRWSSFCWLLSGKWMLKSIGEMGDTPNWGNNMMENDGKWWSIAEWVTVILRTKTCWKCLTQANSLTGCNPLIMSPSHSACVKSQIPSRNRAIKMDLHSKSRANSPKVNCFSVSKPIVPL